MNSWKIGIDNLREIAKTATSADHSYAEKCGLYSAARVILNDIEEHVTERLNVMDGYLFEKAGSVQWHIGAMLGFDVDNDHDAQQHRAWAYSALSILEERLEKHFPNNS